MEAVGLALSAVQTLCSSLQCSELKELFSFLGYTSDLESLQTSVLAIQSMLKDADNKQAHGLKLSAVEQNFIEKIKDVVYDADDLLDEYATKARHQQFRMENGNKLFRKVRRLYSLFENLRDDYLKSPEVKKTAKKLAEIARDASNFKIDCPPIKMMREETCSHVNENLIIGREDDKKRIVDLLLDPNMQGDLPVVGIVGMGGLGKTTLAQLVYNDPRIQKEFPLKLWICVSDQDQNQFDVKAILIAIYESASTQEKYKGGLALDQVVQELGRKLNQNKYLLVFDDLWNEKRDECHKLVDILIRLVQRGSRILVTTRSKRTANAIGSSQPYELRGLSDENSWHLFEMNVGREKANSSEFIEMGKDIVKQCANVPLAIKVVGSLLYDQNENTWRFLQQSIYTYLPGTNEDDDNKIMSILKFSYYRLSPSLKSCFTYCALFPKDFRIEKSRLISLWIAQGYVEKSNGVQTMEEIAEEYFQILVQRCFFEDPQDEYDGRVTFKIHDLMHDIAQQVAGKEIFVAHSVTTGLDKNIRHLYDDAPDTRTNGFITSSKIRTYVHNAGIVPTESVGQFPIGTLIAKWRRLRALDLTNRGIESLPDSIGKLLHLRYLNLRKNHRLRMLPESFTKLINLETLILHGCASLIELPKDLNKLVKLRAIEVYDDYPGISCVLSYMPRMEKLTCLSSLNGFVVAKRKSNLKQDLGGLEDLRALGKLRGSLKIWISDNYKHPKENGWGGYLSNKEHLNSIRIIFADQYFIERENDEEIVGSDEALMEDLKPHGKLKELRVEWYRGVRIPSWAIEDNLAKFLPNLVNINLFGCHGLQSLPWFGKLRFLKSLRVGNLKNLEYMESGTNSNNSYGAAVEFSSSLFFPSLERLELLNLPKLKGWWRELSGMGDDEIVNRNHHYSMQTAGGGHRLPSFPRLSKLIISGCPNLASIPLCPAVEFLQLNHLNERLQIIVEEAEDQNVVGTSNDSRNLTGHAPRNRQIQTGNVRCLKSMPMVPFQRITKMDIFSDHEVESLTEVEEVFRGCSSSLRSLSISHGDELRSVSGGLRYLTALESLTLLSLDELRFDETEQEEEEEEDVTVLPWKCLGQRLRSLELANLKKVVELPKGMRYLTALQSLQIGYLPLKHLPEWIGCLSSLNSLIIERCDLESLPKAMQKLTSLSQLDISSYNPILKRRCDNPDGDDWPKIQHIPRVFVETYITPWAMDLFQ